MFVRFFFSLVLEKEKKRKKKKNKQMLARSEIAKLRRNFSLHLIVGELTIGEV